MKWILCKLFWFDLFLGSNDRRIAVFVHKSSTMSNPYDGAIVGRLKLKGKALKKWGEREAA